MKLQCAATHESGSGTKLPPGDVAEWPLSGDKQTTYVAG